MLYMWTGVLSKSLQISISHISVIISRVLTAHVLKLLSLKVVSTYNLKVVSRL